MTMATDHKIDLMDREEILAAMENLLDANTGLMIQAMRLDKDLSARIHENGLAWRELVLRASGIVLGELEAYRRHLEKKGE